MTTGIRITRNDLTRLIVITVVLWIIWLPVVTSGNIRMDSDRMIHTPDIAFTQYVREGRSALVWLLQLFGLTSWHPVRSGILFLLFFSMSCWILYFSLRRLTGWKGLYPDLFLLLYGLSPIWAYHGYFVLQIAAVGFGMLLAVIIACLDVDSCSQDAFCPHRILREIASLAVLSFILLIYQSLIVCYLAVLLMLLFCRILKGSTFGWRMLIPLIVRLLLSVVIYYLVSGHLRGNMSAGNMDVQIRWGLDSVSHCLLRVAEEIGATLLMYTSRYFSLYTLGAVLAVLLLIRQTKAEPGNHFWLIFICLGMLLLPFSLSVLLGNVTVPRSQFALQLAAAFFPVCYLAETKGNHRVLRTVCIIAVVLQAALSLRLCYTDHVRNSQDTQAADVITTELNQIDTSKPLAFVGVRQMDGQALLTEKSDVFGRTFFEWIYASDNPSSATIPALRLLTAYSGNHYEGISNPDQAAKAVEAAHDMPAYPEPGFVREESEMIVIKLSDP